MSAQARWHPRPLPSVQPEWKPTTATTKAVEPRPEVKEIRKRRRKPNRTGWTKRKGKVAEKRFDAFKVKETVTTKEGETVVTTKVVAPETGIHSLEWAANIQPQKSGFLRLPIEIRKQIYSLLFSDSAINCPRKKGLKYTTIDRTNPVIEQYNKLLEVCRQTYVDLVGGSLLYSYAHFSFSSPDAMIRYLNCINPAHKEAIQSIHLVVTASQPTHLLLNRALEVLATIPNLQALTMDVGISYTICYGIRSHHGPRFRSYEINKHALYYLEKSRWESLKGLRRFEMTFCGTSRRRIGSISIHHRGNDDFIVSEKQREAEERIKAIVMREEL